MSRAIAKNKSQVSVCPKCEKFYTVAQFASACVALRGAASVRFTGSISGPIARRRVCSFHRLHLWPMPSHLVPFTIGGTEFRVEARYTLQKQVGAGAYGVVASAEDAGDARGGGGGAPDSTAVAIKKVGHAYADLVDAKRILREIKLLRSLGGHENVVALHDLFDDHDDVYIVTKLLDTDLHRILYSKQKLTE